MSRERWLVQCYSLLDGWQTWVIYDTEKHAVDECERRKSEARKLDKPFWRVAKETES
jgi:hypothetical protein